MARRGEHRGYLQTGYGDADVLGCSHCRRQIVVAAQKGRDTTSVRLDRCGACHATICSPCAAELAQTMKCRNFEQRLEAVERRANFLKGI